MPIEPETYPDSNVFINKLDIRDLEILNEAEASLTWARTEAYRNNPASGNFDLEHLQQIHHALFQDLYTWAGELRSYDTRKGICEFTPAKKITHYSRKIYGALAEENYLQKLNREEFIHRLAYYYDMTNRLHPFPEGNGRTQRLFIEHLATLSGHSIKWTLVHQWEIEATAERSFQGDKEPLFRMFERIACITHQEIGSSN